MKGLGGCMVVTEDLPRLGRASYAEAFRRPFRPNSPAPYAPWNHHGSANGSWITSFLGNRWFSTSNDDFRECWFSPS